MSARHMKSLSIKAPFGAFFVVTIKLRFSDVLCVFLIAFDDRVVTIIHVCGASV
jgi:hypothetical protein